MHPLESGQETNLYPKHSELLLFRKVRNAAPIQDKICSLLTVEIEYNKKIGHGYYDDDTDKILKNVMERLGKECMNCKGECMHFWSDRFQDYIHCDCKHRKEILENNGLTGDILDSINRGEDSS